MKKSIVPPLVGMLALLPGALMYSFALSEATRLDHDWVKLCAPLLFIGASSFAWLLQRRAGTPGAGIGLAIAAFALGGLGVHLQTTVTKRARWQASSRALSSTDRFCDGQVTPQKEARAFVEGAPNPTLVFHTGTSGYAESWSESSLDPLRPEPYQLENAALVACAIDKRVSVEKCEGYTGGGVAERVRVDVTVQVFAIKTGARIFDETFTGETPRACAHTEKFFGKDEHPHVTITGERPPQAEVLAALIAVIKK